MENINVVGIIRTMDDLGRIVIPKEIRKAIGIAEGDSIDILATREGALILRKVVNNTPTCSCPCATDNNRNYTVRNNYNDDYLKVIKVTPEQDKLLDFLCNEEMICSEYKFTPGYPEVEDFTK